jgi:hypothetical protein
MKIVIFLHSAQTGLLEAFRSKSKESKDVMSAYLLQIVGLIVWSD